MIYMSFCYLKTKFRLDCCLILCCRLQYPDIAKAGNVIKSKSVLEIIQLTTRIIALSCFCLDSAKDENAVSISFITGFQYYDTAVQGMHFKERLRFFTLKRKCSKSLQRTFVSERFTFPKNAEF